VRVLRHHAFGCTDDGLRALAAFDKLDEWVDRHALEPTCVAVVAVDRDACVAGMARASLPDDRPLAESLADPESVQ